MVNISCQNSECIGSNFLTFPINDIKAINAASRANNGDASVLLKLLKGVIEQKWSVLGSALPLWIAEIQQLPDVQFDTHALAKDIAQKWCPVIFLLSNVIFFL